MSASPSRVPPIGGRADYCAPALLPIPTPPAPYRAILADPPWRFVARTALTVQNWASRRDVERHYGVMDLAAIKALPVGRLAAADAHLFLWATGPCLQQAFEVIEAWGFRYSALGFNWVKVKRALRRPPAVIDEADLHVGLGLTTRHNSELCLLARRGNARRKAQDVREVILSPVEEHSKKPEESRERIERYCDGPYLELFARRPRPGWDSWGDALGGFVPSTAAGKGGHIAAA